jgi:hypothetical protein
MRRPGMDPGTTRRHPLKKQMKKLALSKETVYALSNLAAVRGNEEIPPVQPTTLRFTWSCAPQDPCIPYNDTQL